MKVTAQGPLSYALAGAVKSLRVERVEDIQAQTMWSSLRFGTLTAR